MVDYSFFKSVDDKLVKVDYHDATFAVEENSRVLVRSLPLSIIYLKNTLSIVAT